jgi:hypothetical protein
MRHLWLVIAALLAWRPGAGAYELKRDSSGAPVRWRTSPSFVIDQAAAEQLGEPRAFVAAQAAVDAFARRIEPLAASLYAGNVSGPGYDAANPAANQNELVVVQDSWELDTGAIAITVVTIDLVSHTIVDADIALNDEHRDFAVLDLPEDNSRFDDLQNTLTHELGHALGLGHSTDASAAMYGVARRGELTKRVLAPDDLAGLAALYQGEVKPVEVGCASAGSALPWPCLLPLTGYLRTRRRKLPTPLPG